MNQEERQKLVVELIAKSSSSPSLLQRESFNETRNDRWIMECIYPGKQGGFFVEAGASSGLWASSCYLLEKKMNWTGICIEPNDSFFEQLIVNRPGSICENVCLSDSPGTVSFIQGVKCKADPYLSGIKENLEQFKSSSEAILKSGQLVQKAATTLEKLLDKHSAPTIIDYAAFDIEGSELRVLEHFPFERYQFSALSLECDQSMWADITALLSQNGYREVKNPFNVDMPWERYWLHQTMRTVSS